MADLRISELATLAGANLAAGDFLPIADTSASETKKITVTDLVGNATTLIADATIPSAKIVFGANTIPGGSLTNASITATQLANDAVTAAKLADESSVDLVTTLPASGAFVGQLALDTDDSKIYCWDGSTWVSIKAAGGVNAVLGSTAGVINIVATTVGDQVTISATLDNTTAAAEFLAGPTASAGTVGYRPIVGADLPTATTTTKGAVIVNGNGLTLSGDTITINNTVTAEASNFHIVQYNAKGLVTSGRVISASDVPIATASVNGIVKPGSGLGVNGSGSLNHTNAIGAGSGVKVSFDTEGHITGAASLVEADIPNLSAAKITTGTLDIDRIGGNAVTGVKLANFAITKIGSTIPSADSIGQFFFNPLSRDLSLWDGNVYQPVGISAGEIVFAGTYDAATNTLSSVTSEGSAAGFVNGSALPAAAGGNSRYYVVVNNGGTGTSPAPTVTLQPPDILLSNGTNYILIDVSQTFTSQSAVNISFSPTGTIAASNVQAAIAEVASEALQAAGSTLTGQLLIGSAGSLVFEGATDNAFETTLGVVDPTADNVINLPNVSGTVITSGDTGTVTSALIADGTIVNADINAGAAIDYSKLAALTSGNIVLGNASNVPTSTAVTGDITISNAGVTAISSGVIVNADINASAAIDYSKLAALTSGNILIGNASNVATSTAVTGDITISNAGVTAIASGVIVNADINASAAIDYSKLATLTAGNIVLGNSSNVATSTPVTGDITISDAGVTAIASGAIVDADINANAEIAVSKLADGAARQLLQTDAAGTGVEWTNNIDVPGTLDVTGAAVFDGTITAKDNVTLNAQSDLRLADSDSSNWVALQAPATIASNVTWTLPAVDGTNGQVLSTNGTGTLSWATAGGGGGLTLLNTISVSFGASNVTYTSIPSSKVIIVAASANVFGGNTAGLIIRLSSDDGSTFGSTYNISSAFGTIPAGIAHVYNANINGAIKNLLVYTTASDAITNGRESSVTGVINAIRIALSGGNIFSSGTLYFYGLS